MGAPPAAPDAPDEVRPERIYGTVFFPWPAPVPLSAGDVVCLDLDSRLVDEDYIWNWKTTVLDRGQAVGSKAAFTQSTLLGVPISPLTLQRTAGSYRPALNDDGLITRRVLTSMDGGTAVEEIAEQIATEYPARFPRPQDALSYVADLSRRYGAAGG